MHDDLERYRVVSTSSNLDNERMAAVIAAGGGQQLNTRRHRDSSRMSLDEGARELDASTLQKKPSIDRRERRRTVTEIFSRDNRG